MKLKTKTKLYIKLIEELDDDETFINFYYLVPFTLLENFVPKLYLHQRYEYLLKIGKLKKNDERKEKK